MKCPNCNINNERRVEFCRVCGTRLLPHSDNVIEEAKPNNFLAKQTITVGGVTFTMIHVTGGTFTMGCTDEYGSVWEKPAHQVSLSDYYIGETEVTQALWKAVMGNNPSCFKGDDLPVECVNWFDCQEFISKLNAATGKRFRLPTEAEWEYAARGGSKSQGYKYSGSNNIDEVAWYCENSDYKTHKVKSLMRNELGLYDMSGNVSELCSDLFNVYESGWQVNPKGPNKDMYWASSFVIRGGSYDSSAGICRVLFRNEGSFDGCSARGLRLVLPDDATPEVKLTEVDRADVREITANGVKFTMVHVTGGTFTMGCTDEQDS